jgi:hypothetical protein
MPSFSPPTRRPSTPISAIDVAPQSRPNARCQITLVPPSHDTIDSTAGYSGGCPAEGNSWCVKRSRNGSMKNFPDARSLACQW